MKDVLDKYIEKRKKKDKAFALDYEIGYENFKIIAMLRQMRENARDLNKIFKLHIN